MSLVAFSFLPSYPSACDLLFFLFLSNRPMDGRLGSTKVTQIVEERQRFYPIVTGDEFVVHHDVEEQQQNNNNSYDSVTTSEERPTTSSSSSSLSSRSTITNTVEYQVTALTERIAFLTQHLQHQPTDFSTRRGLVALVNKRRRILTILDRNDSERHQSVIKSLGIRHHRPASTQ